MILLQSFYDFLQITRPSSAIHYESGVRAVSKDMQREKVITKPIEEMSLPEFEISIFNILHNDFFIAKNKRGNNMYSNSLKQYQNFLKISEKDSDFNEIENSIRNDKNITPTESLEIIKSRIGQGIFRDKLIAKYHKCIISGISDSRLLVASHVKPWSISNNTERLDSENGLLLSSLYDKMFDLGLITFENSGKIEISNSVKKADRKKFSLLENTYFDLKITTPLKEHLEYHRDIIFIK